MQKYQKYYENYSAFAPFKFLMDSFFERSRTGKLSLLNRQKDYAALHTEPERFALHRTLNELVTRSQKEWASYDYGSGYFYQSCEQIGLRGLRATGLRVQHMDLLERVKGKTVLEIGCNSGFLSLAMAPVAKHVVGFDINPVLIEVAHKVADFLGITNADLSVVSFEDYQAAQASSGDEGAKFDVVLSFANHSTYDGNTEQSVDDFFRKCASLTKPGGTLIFESHPPEHEGDGLPGVVETIERYFDIHERKVLEYGTFLDTGRTFIVATLKASA